MDAIRDGHPPESVELAQELIEVAELALWCRDAGLAYVYLGHSWPEIVQVTGVSDSTLQSRWRKWYERGGGKECRG